jgi:hypothetical protein
MKKAIILSGLLLSICTISFSQEVGYNTTDVGAEYQYYEEGGIYKLHLAVNSKLHHSFHFSVGYNSVNASKQSPVVKKYYGGLAAGLGYRYYFTYKPHQFFAGVRFDFISRKTELDLVQPEKINSSRLISAAEFGYMILVNDMFFITPSVSLGASLKTNSKYDNDFLDEGFVFLPGISMGFKF